MKSYTLFILLLAVLFSSAPSFAQNRPAGITGNPTNRMIGSTSKQSSTADSNNSSGNAIDLSISGPGAITHFEENPWWEASLGGNSFIEEVKIHYDDDDGRSSLTGYYILISPVSMEGHSLSDLVSNINVTSIFVNTVLSQGAAIPINRVGGFVRIQLLGNGILGLKEVELPGFPFNFIEDCSNGIDDDFDGLIDCDDDDCTGLLYSVTKTDPTCPICNDGQINIQAFGDNLVYSIDGGITFSTHCINNDQGDICTFSGLNNGDYNIVIKNALNGCEAEYSNNPVRLIAPLGNPTGGSCFNGGFEEGTFEGWTGGQTTWHLLPTPVFDNEFLGVNNTHAVINTDDFVDFAVPVINGDFKKLGQYIARLGDFVPGDGAERLTYCFTITEDNADFGFWYALVLEDPGHSGGELNPFFDWSLTIRDNDGNITNTPCGRKTIADADNPFFETTGVPGSLDEVIYKAWTCERCDLNPFIGSEVCFTAIIADCNGGLHEARAYIDGLCSSIGLEPEVDLLVNPIACESQPLVVEIFGGGYNRFQWIINQVDDNGNDINFFTGPVIIGNNARLDDALNFYQQQGGFGMSCDGDLKITFRAISDCGEQSVSKIVDRICNNYNIDYCEDILVCGFKDVQITGVNDCDNCTYNWSPSQFLYNPTSKFPTVNATDWANSLDREYTVEVTTPEGCIFNDAVFVEVNDFNTNAGVGLTQCEAGLSTTITFDHPVSGDRIVVTAEDKYSGEIVQLSSGTQVSNIFTFTTTVPRDKTKKFIITIEVFSIDGCGDDSCIRDKIELVEIPETIFNKRSRVYVPDTFNPSPGGSPANDFFRPHIASYADGASPCSGNTVPVSSIYFLQLDVFDRWGNQVWSATETRDVSDGNGLFGDEIKWDGTFNGQLMNPGVFAYILRGRTCFEGVNDCANDPPPPGNDELGGFHPTTQFFEISGDVTLLQ